MPPSKMTHLPCEGEWEYEPGVGIRWAGRLVRDTFDDPRPSGRHGAVDIATAARTLILAREDGRILRAAWDSLWGRYIYLLGRSGHMYVDAHLDEFKVKRGQQVRAGDLIALSGNTGNSSGPHWHGEEWARSGDRSSRLDFRPKLVQLVKGVHVGLSTEQDERLRKIEEMLTRFLKGAPSMKLHDQREAKRRDEIIDVVKETHGGVHD